MLALDEPLSDPRLLTPDKPGLGLAPAFVNVLQTGPPPPKVLRTRSGAINSCSASAFSVEATALARAEAARSVSVSPENAATSGRRSSRGARARRLTSLC